MIFYIKFLNTHIKVLGHYKSLNTHIITVKLQWVNLAWLCCLDCILILSSIAYLAWLCRLNCVAWLLHNVLSQIHLPRHFVMLVPQICVDGSESYEHIQVEEEGGYVELQSQQPFFRSSEITIRAVHPVLVYAVDSAVGLRLLSTTLYFPIFWWWIHVFWESTYIVLVSEIVMSNKKSTYIAQEYK